MKKILFLIVANLVFAMSFCQIQEIRGHAAHHEIAYYVDSVYIGTYLGIDVKSIDSIKVVKEPVEIDGKWFEASYYFYYKQKTNLILLKELVEKYSKKPVTAPVYMVNGSFIKGNVSTFRIDADFVLRVDFIHSCELGYYEEALPFTIVSILTKTEENEKKIKQSRMPFVSEEDIDVLKKHLQVK